MDKQSFDCKKVRIASIDLSWSIGDLCTVFLRGLPCIGMAAAILMMTIVTKKQTNDFKKEFIFIDNNFLLRRILKLLLVNSTVGKHSILTSDKLVELVDFAGNREVNGLLSEFDN